MRAFRFATRTRWRRILVILALIGPGIITANVDNDAGGIATYSLAGGNFGYAHLWALLPIGIFLFVIQEMSARLGAITGKGLADLIRENFGLRVAFWVLLLVSAVNLTNTMGEFAGVASAAEIFGASRYPVNFFQYVGRPIAGVSAISKEILSLPFQVGTVAGSSA